MPGPHQARYEIVFKEKGRWGSGPEVGSWLNPMGGMHERENALLGMTGP